MHDVEDGNLYFLGSNSTIFAIRFMYQILWTRDIIHSVGL